MKMWVGIARALLVRAEVHWQSSGRKIWAGIALTPATQLSAPSPLCILVHAKSLGFIPWGILLGKLQDV